MVPGEDAWMLKIRVLMSTDLLTVSPEASLREAAELFSDEHIGGAPVVSGGSPVGVVSIHDILTFESSHPGAPTTSEPAPDWQGPDESGDTWPEEETGNAALYYTDIWSDAGGEVVERFGTTDRPEWSILDEHTVSEVMTPTIESLPPDTGAQEAARYLIDHDLHRVLVLDEDGELLGVLTTTDLVRALAEQGLGG